MVGTVTSITAHSLDPGSASKTVYKDGNSRHFVTRTDPKYLDWVASQGTFGSRPSDLFLKMFGDVLEAVATKPESAVVSPALLGTSGVVPLSIVSIIPDIMLQYADCIKTSRQEVLIATNAWEPGRCVDIIVAAIRELNHRCQQENRRVVIKLLMDAASLRNAIQSRYARPAKSWPDISLPTESEIPNIDLEVVNYHVAPLGTFHSKFAVFDREVALVNSNNINLRSNVEMMTRFEGAVVDSLYDTFLISWHTKLSTSWPCLSTPSSSRRNFVFAHDEPNTITRASYEHTNTISSNLSSLQNQLTTNRQHYEDQDQPVHSISVNQRLNVQEHVEQTADAVDTDDFHPYMFHPRHSPVPMALVNRQPHNLPGHNDVVNPQNNAWLAALKYAKRSVFIQSPVCNGSPMLKGIIDACVRGITVTIYVGLGFNDFAEAIVPFQGGSNVDVLKKLQDKLRPHGDHILSNLRWHWYTAKDQIMPLRFEKQARNCHVKFMNVDDEVAIMGSGNQDTQSWFHSQEVNVMIDSQLLCKDWTAGFRRIQNTAQYGKVDHFASAAGTLVTGETIPKKKGMGGLKRSSGGFL